MCGIASFSCESFSHVLSAIKFNRLVIGLKIKEQHICGLNVGSHVTTGKHGDEGCTYEICFSVCVVFFFIIA